MIPVLASVLIRMKKKLTVDLRSEKSKQCKEWMSYFKGQSAPWVFDFKSLLKDLSCKEAEAHSEVDAFMENL